MTSIIRGHAGARKYAKKVVSGNLTKVREVALCIDLSSYQMDPSTKRQEMDVERRSQIQKFTSSSGCAERVTQSVGKAYLDEDIRAINREDDI